MKISIEIDDTDGTVSKKLPHGAEPGSPSQPPVPPEIAARDLTLGATDGGAAPSELPRAGAPPVPSAIAGLTAASPDAGASGEGAISAGAAFVDTAPILSQTVEQDPEAPSAPDEGG